MSRRSILLLAAAVAVPSFLTPSGPGASQAASLQENAQAPSPQPLLDQDPRLEKRITLRLGKSPLSAVTAELTQQMELAISASRDVADDPAIVYATDRPAKEVMRRLAALFNYRWMRKGRPGAYTYELYQDLKSRQEEEALRQRDRLRALEAVQVEFREYLALAQRPLEQLRRLASEYDAIERAVGQAPPGQRETASRRLEPLHRARFMANSVDRALIRVVALFSPAQWTVLLNGARLSFSTRPEPGYAPLPAALADELRVARPSRAGHVLALNPTPESEARHREYEAQLQRQWARAEAFRVTVRIELDSLDSGLANTQQATLRIEAQPVIPAPPGGYVAPSLLGVRGRAGTLAEKPTPAGPEAAKDPVLGRKRPVTLDPPAIKIRYRSVAWLSRFLPRIAETYGVNLIADAYRHPSFSLPPLPAGEERPLYEVLDQLVLPVARWSKQGEFILVRQRNWYQARVAEVPDRLVRHWATRMRQERRLTLDGATELALALNDEQLKTFIPALHDEGLRLSDEFYPSYGEIWDEFLRAYGSLTPAQRQALRAGRPVAYASMPAVARQWLQVALDQREQPVPEREAGHLSLELQEVERVVSATERGFTIVYRTAAPPGGGEGASFRPQTLWTETRLAEQGALPLGSERLQPARFRFEYGAPPTRVDVEFRPPSIYVEPGPSRETGPPRP